MPFLAIPFPAIDPVIIAFGPFAIRWYALAYVTGIMAGWWYIGKLDKQAPVAFSPKAFDDVIMWAVGGIILGGRLGYVLFYNFGYYLNNPVEALQIWHGGMSFHGGLIGVITAILLMCRKHNLRFWPVIDMMACATPIGLGLGRLANFINGELYGRTTDVAWGIVFPHGGELPRHPSQLYEATLEGLVLFCVLAYFVKRTYAKSYPGSLSGLFLIGYALSRIIVEFFREPDVQVGFLAGGITMGQILCIPMLLFGIGLIGYAKKRGQIVS